MPKQELDLIQFAAGEMAQSGTRTPKVVRNELFSIPARVATSRTTSHSTLDVIPLPPDPAGFVADRKSAPAVIPLASFHVSIASLTHAGTGMRSYVSGLAQKIGNDLVLFAQLDAFDVQAEKLSPAESTSEQHGEDASSCSAKRIVLHPVTCRNFLHLNQSLFSN